MNEITQRSIDMQNAIEDDYDVIVRENAELMAQVEQLRTKGLAFSNASFDYANSLADFKEREEFNLALSKTQPKYPSVLDSSIIKGAWIAGAKWFCDDEIYREVIQFEAEQYANQIRQAKGGEL